MQLAKSNSNADHNSDCAIISNKKEKSEYYHTGGGRPLFTPQRRRPTVGLKIWWSLSTSLSQRMAQRPPLPTSGSVDSQESGRRGSGSPAPSFSNFTGALSKVGFASKRFTVRITTHFFYLCILKKAWFISPHNLSKSN